jgi:hypothetical protein
MHLGGCELRRLRRLEDENGRLILLVANLTLDWPRRRKRRTLHRGSQKTAQVVDLDCVRDTLVEGRPFRVLRVLDQWSHQSPLREVGTRISA